VIFVVEITKRAIRIFEAMKLVEIKAKNMDEACDELQISRASAYRYLDKIRTKGIEGLNYQSHEAWNRTDNETEKQIIEIKKERAGRSAPLICHLMKKRHDKRVYQSTVKRAIERCGIDFKRSIVKEPIKPYEMKRFGDMWQIDTFERKCIPKTGTVYIVLVIDDYSRAILAGMAFKRDSTPNNMLLLRVAIEGYGIPHSIKADNDTKFKTMRGKGETELVRACREIGCVMFSHKPYNPKSKGKVERRIPFIDEWFIKENKFTSLEDLNRKLQKFIAWFNTEFKISSTGTEPVKRIHPSSTKKIPRRLNLDDVFCENILRYVRSDCTISFKSKKYIVGEKFISEKVEVHVVHYKKIIRIWHKKRLVKTVSF
jgi:transposase